MKQKYQVNLITFVVLLKFKRHQFTINSFILFISVQKVKQYCSHIKELPVLLGSWYILLHIKYVDKVTNNFSVPVLWTMLQDNQKLRNVFLNDIGI